MKKLIYLIVLALILGLVLTGCFLSNVGQVPTNEQSGIAYLTKHTEDYPQVIDLLAGQDILVGTVNVWNDLHDLYVEYELDDGWCMTESHLAVATSLMGIPQTKKGNPIPGKFEYGDNYDPCSSGDTFTISLASLGGGGTQLYIAAHAVVWDKSSETTIEVVSGTDTDVTAVNGVPGVQNAVKSIEPVNYPNCPTGDDDTVDSLWDIYAKLSGDTLPDWMGADWIWSTDYPANPVNGEYVDFSALFEVPGLPVGGTLTITADNAYSASLNGVPVGSSISLGPGFPGTLKENVGSGPQVDDWGVASQGWQLVEEWPLNGLTSGNNELAIRATNEYQFMDDNYKDWDYSAQTYSDVSIITDLDGDTLCINPAGLIFKASVDYYTHSETAWAYGDDFSGANWATYFTYTVQLPQDGMVLWLDANAITGLTGGKKVGQWNDLSGEENHAIQTTVDNQPTYITSELNELPVVHFDGADDHLIIDDLLAGGASGRTIFIVANSNTTENTAIFILNNDLSGSGIGRYYDITPEIWVRVQGNQQFDESFPNEFTLLTIGNAVSAKIEEIYGWLDGSSLTAGGSSNGTTILNVQGTSSSIGSIPPDYITTRAWEGDIAEILVYNRALSDSERGFVETYLKAKYNL